MSDSELPKGVSKETHLAISPRTKKMSHTSSISLKSEYHYDNAASEEELSPDLPIEKIIEYIVHEQLGLKADVSQWAKKLQDNLVFNREHLGMLTLKQLESIDLPVLLKAVLSDYCKPSPTKLTGNSKRQSDILTRGSNSIKKPKQIMISDSNDGMSFGLTEEERDAVLNSWNLVVEKDNRDISEKSVDNFYTILWREWLKVDQKAKELFKNRDMVAKKQHIGRVMGMIIRAVDNPADVQAHFSRLSIPHCIWAIKEQNFDAFGLSLISALEETLGGDIITASLKESWLTLITNMGEMITDGYESVKKGWIDTLYKRDGHNWKKVWTKLTDNVLYLYKSSSMKKSNEKYMFNLARDVSSLEENEDGLNPINKYCFYIQFGPVKKYFCASSEEKLQEWMENVVWRIKGYARLHPEEPGEDHGNLFLTTEEKRRLAARQDPIRRTNEQIKMHARTKNHKLLKMRYHLDAQIRKDSEFLLFDNLVHATIVINEQAIIEYVNPACIDLTGYEPGQLVGQNVNKIMPRSVANVHDSYIANYLRTRKASIIGVGRYVTLKQNKGNEVSCFLTVTVHTTTGRRLFVGTLTEGGDSDSSSSEMTDNISETSFTVFDNLLQSTIVISKEGTVEYINSATEKYLGWVKQEVVGRNVKMLMIPSMASKHDQYLQNYLTTGVSKIIGVGRDVPIQHKSGAVLNGHLEITEHKLSTSSYFIGTLIPKEEMSLDSFVEEHRDILGSLDVPVLIIGENGVIHMYNKSAQKSFGYRESQVKGKNVAILMTKEHARKHNTYLSNYLTTGKAKIIGKGRVVNVKCKSGNVRQCHLTVSERTKGTYRLFIGILAILY